MGFLWKFDHFHEWVHFFQVALVVGVLIKVALLPHGSLTDDVAGLLEQFLVEGLGAVVPGDVDVVVPALLEHLLQQVLLVRMRAPKCLEVADGLVGITVCLPALLALLSPLLLDLRLQIL